MKEYFNLYKTMLVIRRFEERLLLEFSSGNLVGTTHTYIGEEANAAGIFSKTKDDDVFFSNHRCHGHFIAYGGDPYHLAAEIMGKATGLVGGRGGSQHIHWRNFYSNGIQGGIVPIATGMAFAEKAQKTDHIAVVFIGDGTLGEGVVYESMNLAALWTLPILVVVENNRYAQTTPVELGVSGSMSKRFEAFGIQVWERESSDVLEIQAAAEEAIQFVRSRSRPGCLLLHTHRFSAHSKGDDTRSKGELTRIQQFDPLKIHKSRLTSDEIDQAEKEAADIVNGAFLRASTDSSPSLVNEG